MITKAKQNPTPSITNDAISIGSAIKQNIVEKLPVINAQVILQKKKEIKSKNKL